MVAVQLVQRQADTHHLYDPLCLVHTLYVKASSRSLLHLSFQLLVGLRHLREEALQPVQNWFTGKDPHTHTHTSLNITLMLFGRSTIDQLVTKKNAWHSHRCFWGLSLSAVIFQLLDWGEASHWDLAAQHTDQLLLMTKLMLLYCGKRKTRFSWVG